MANQGRRDRTSSVRNAKLPIHEGFQVDHPQQPDQGLSGHGQRHSSCLQDLGEYIAALKGKTTRSKSTPVARDFVKVPMEMMKLHKEVYLTMDIFFLNKIPFFLTLSRKICFTAVNHLSSRSTRQIFEAFKDIYLYYLQRGFRITTVSADGEFAPLHAFIESLPGGPRVNLASANEHVPEIERRIRVVKERCQATCYSLPFMRIPTLLMVNIVLNAVKLLNLFPTEGGMSDTISPRTIMSGDTLDYKKDLCIQIK
jgi:hypothetical protein